MGNNEDFGIAIIDRIEEGMAVFELIEPRFNFQMPVEVLPDEIHEGAAVELDFKLRPEIEEKRRRQVRDLQQELLDNSQNPEEEK